MSVKPQSFFYYTGACVTTDIGQMLYSDGVAESLHYRSVFMINYGFQHVCNAFSCESRSTECSL